MAPIRGCTTSACPRTLPRLNVRFPGTQEPALDAFEQMDSMESTARAYNKFHGRASNTPISPVSGIKETGMLETLADRLRASLHYLQVKSISRLDEVYIIRGWIRCRIEPSNKGSHRFLKQTSGFKVKKTFYSAAGVRRLSGSPPMSLEVEFTHYSPDEPIRINVDFGKSHMVTTSGFPIKINANLKSMNKAGKTPLDLARTRSQATDGNTYNTYGPLIESLDWEKPEPECEDGDGGCNLM